MSTFQVTLNRKQVNTKEYSELNNARVVTAIKELSIVTLRELVRTDNDLFKNINKNMAIDLASNLVSVIVANGIKTMVELSGVRPPYVLEPMINSILRLVDYDVIKPNEINLDYPIIPTDKLSALVETIRREVSLYKNQFLPEMRNIIRDVSEKINNLSGIDLNEIFSIVSLDDSYMYELAEKRGYFNKYNIKYNDPYMFVNNLPNKAANFNLMDLVNNMPYNDMKTNLEDYTASLLNFDHILGEAEEVWKETTLAAVLRKANTHIRSFELDALFLNILALRNFLENNSEELGDGEIMGYKVLYNEMVDRFLFFRERLKSNIQRGTVIWGIEKESKTDIIVYVIGANLKLENNEFGTSLSLSHIYGAALDRLYQSENLTTKKIPVSIRLEDIAKNPQYYLDMYDKYLQTLSMSLRQNDLIKLVNIYALSFRDNFKVGLKYSLFDTPTAVYNTLVKWLSDEKLSKLLDPDKMVMELYPILVQETNFILFMIANDEAVNILGDDVDSDQVAFYATSKLIVDFFLSQLNIVQL
jgi:hypothetical protein